jgi:glycosyltransferase involved in cell wall biosynthesis
MVKNEEDVIVPVVEHLFRQGVDAALIADNGSSDHTPALLEELAERFPVHLALDREGAFYQDLKMTFLADWARKAGADWIIPFDADELWFAPRTSLVAYLRSFQATVVYAAMHDLFPVDGVSLGEGPWRLDTSPHRLRKVAFRTHRHAVLEYGNHGVSRPGQSVAGLRVVHVPWRSYEQFRMKGLQGSRAVSLADADPALAYQWHTIAALDSDGAKQAWESIIAGKPVDGICWSPGTPSRLADPLKWLFWDPEGLTSS